MDDPTVNQEGPRPSLPSELPDSYAFVMNVKALNGAASFQLTEEHALRRANSSEIAGIKETLEALPAFTNPIVRYLWECPWPYPVGRPLESLPAADWRYFVIAFRGSNAALEELKYAIDLAPTELEIAFTRFADTGLLFHPDRLFHVLKQAPYDEQFFVEIGGNQVEELMEIHALLQKRSSKSPDHRLITQLGALKGLPHDSPLRFLGYFALLESLLTHQPKQTDPYDSITRQIIAKLTLLDHRLPIPINYRPFAGALPKTIWNKMYDCRSKTAHGGTPDFSKDLKVLKSREEALRLIKDTTKAVITQALREPQLLFDLREC